MLMALTFTLLYWPGASSSAQQLPKRCYDGERALKKTHQYALAVKLLTRCIQRGGLSKKVLATAYFFRAAAYFSPWLNKPKLDKMKTLEIALQDIDKAIKLDGSVGEYYCLRGNLINNLSEGWAGYDDIDQRFI